MMYLAWYVAIGLVLGVIAIRFLPRGKTGVMDEMMMVLLSGICWPYLVVVATRHALKKP